MGLGHCRTQGLVDEEPCEEERGSCRGKNLLEGPFLGGGRSVVVYRLELLEGTAREGSITLTLVVPWGRYS